MNRLDRPLSNAVNAVVQLDCPWCSASVRATDPELADGLACPACLVVVRLDPAPVTTLASRLAAVAA